ncbi:MAG: diguanylate cyclase [Clostridia bacterium]|nr:diguanylate cyclase [Clostridia bacterium]
MKNTKISIHAELLIAVITTIIVIAVIIGGIGVYSVNEVILNTSTEIMSNSCEKAAAIINDELGDIEKTVSVMADYASNELNNFDVIYDESLRKQYLSELKDHFLDLSDHASGAVSYYMELNMDECGTDDGFYFVIPERGAVFSEIEKTTELSEIYSEVTKLRKPVWVNPHYDERCGKTLISHIAPVYKNGVFYAVIGMGIDYSLFTEEIDRMEVYKNGYAYLTDEFKIAYHKELKMGEDKPERNDGFYEVTSLLKNGMALVFSVSYDDINERRYSVVSEIVLATVFITAIIILIAILIIRKLVSPIKKMTVAAIDISQGNYNIITEVSHLNEIDALNSAFKKMAIKLNEHDRHYRQLAYTDSLTGLKNVASYKLFVEECDEKILLFGYEPGVVVLDINDLKETNDKFGHEAGNRLIVTASQLISGTFKRSKIFRIGGDEFAVVLKDRDYGEWQSLIEKLDRKTEESFVEFKSNKIPVKIARGVAFFDKEKDESFVDVFNRADDSMYAHKREMKN